VSSRSEFADPAREYFSDVFLLVAREDIHGTALEPSYVMPRFLCGIDDLQLGPVPGMTPLTGVKVLTHLSLSLAHFGLKANNRVVERANVATIRRRCDGID